MFEMVTLGKVVSEQSEMNFTVQWLSCIGIMQGGGTLYNWRGSWCQFVRCKVSMWFPMSLVFASLVSSQPHHFFSYCFPSCTLKLGISSLSFRVLSGEFSAHSCHSCCLSCLEVTRGIGENSRNFSYHVGATQPIQNYLPSPSCEYMQLCRFDTLPPYCKSAQLWGARCTNFSSTMYATNLSRIFLELSMIYPSHQLCSRYFCQSIHREAQGNFCDSVLSSPPSMQHGALPLFYLGFVHESQVANVDNFSSESSYLVKERFVGISRLL